MNQEDFLEYNRVSKKFEVISQKYHKLSLLFYELSKSIKLEGHSKTPKEFKAYMKLLNLDIKKIISLSQGIKDIELEDIQNENNENIRRVNQR
jgi:hypothetical protein